MIGELLIETNRLNLRAFKNGDGTFILRLLNDETWLRFIGDRGVRTIQDAQNYLINGPMKSYSVNGFGLSCVVLKSSGEPIGACGLLKRDYLNYPDLGFAFLPEFTGKGYAYEIASATLEYASRHLNIPIVVAITTPDNARSIALLKRIGMTPGDSIFLPDSMEEMLLFTT